jgi:hypothetical protein
MKRFIYILFIISGWLTAQNVQSTVSIKNSFSTQNITAYQNSSVGLIQDFYEYLSLYSKETHVELKKQIKTNIYSLIETSEFQILNVWETKEDFFSLEEFLKEIDSKNYQFKVENLKISNHLKSDHWVNSYDLKILKGKETIVENVEQIIYFQPEEKQFGSKTKIVWNLKLGSINP